MSVSPIDKSIISHQFIFVNHLTHIFNAKESKEEFIFGNVFGKPLFFDKKGVFQTFPQKNLIR